MILTKEERKWFDIVVGNTKEFHKIPEKLKNDKNFILKFLECQDNYMWDILFKIFDDNYKEIINVIKGEKVFNVIPKELLTDDFLEECVKNYNFLYIELPKKYKNEKLKKLANNSDVLEYYIKRLEK